MRTRHHRTIQVAERRSSTRPRRKGGEDALPERPTEDPALCNDRSADSALPLDETAMGGTTPRLSG
jgi:hypothetical protein